MARHGGETRRVIRDLREFVEDRIVKLVVNVTHELEFQTPEDTGWAQHSWIPGLDSVNTTSGSKINVGQAAAAQAAGINAVIAGYRFPNTVFITNNVPYIDILNSPQTNSRKAPPGFVQASIAIGIKSVT